METKLKDAQHKSEVRDGMRIEWDVPIEMDDGLLLRADVYPCAGDFRLSNMKNAFTGCGPFLHEDPRDLPDEVFGRRMTIHTGPGRESHLLLPFIPPK